MVNAIAVTIEPPFRRKVSSRRLKVVAGRALAAEGVGDAELSVLVTGDETIHALNLRYADEDKPTDVLSFSLREGEEFVSPDDVVRLGEVIISYETAARQAADAGRGVADEIDHLLVHGILHLLGYDHAEPDEERAMFARAAELLSL